MGDRPLDRDDALAKLISVRHHCFQRGVLGNRKKGHDEPADDDFRQAFRTLNQAYVRLRDYKAPISLPKRTGRFRTNAK